jgi:hypothetical protein
MERHDSPKTWESAGTGGRNIKNPNRNTGATGNKMIKKRPNKQKRLYILL